MRRDSDSLCCQTHGWFTVAHGTDAFGRPYCDDMTCPECGAEPSDALNPDLVTDDSPLLEYWIAENNPGCEVCANTSEEDETYAQFVLPADRQPAEKHLRWKCPVHGWVDNTGHVIPTGEKVAE